MAPSPALTIFCPDGHVKPPPPHSEKVKCVTFHEAACIHGRTELAIGPLGAFGA